MKREAVAFILAFIVLVSVGGGYLIGTTNERTVTTTNAQYPVTFLEPPKGCSIQSFCINATLVDHLGSNITVVAVAWLRNATTGQNVTMVGGVQNSLATASCTVGYRGPSVCYIIGHPASGNSFEVTLTLFGLDGKTALSPTVTADVTN
ncbi:MAG: hypothetical protein JRM73_02195 [Nitrososphaerota archaeon]|nr:hypothetical protein [Nitrososphaerota archaeon]